MAADNTISSSASTPPLVSFKTIKNVITDFRTKGVLPPRIDKRVFPTFSNTVANQTVAALRFLNLIDEAGVPTPILQALADPAEGEAAWRSTLDAAISLAYDPVMDIELDKVHDSHLRDKFKEVFGLEGDAQRKAIAFFLFAARDAGMKLSPYLRLRERGPSKGPRKKRERASAPGEEMGGESAETKKSPPPSGPGGTRKVHEHQMALIEMVNTYTDAPQELKDALLKMVGYIATKGVVP